MDHNAFADLCNPAIFMVPHGNRRTLQAAVVELFFGGYLSRLPGAGVCLNVRDYPIGRLFFEYLAPDRLFIRRVCCRGRG